jgi:hypothetical protein
LDVFGEKKRKTRSAKISRFSTPALAVEGSAYTMFHPSRAQPRFKRVDYIDPESAHRPNVPRELSIVSGLIVFPRY